MRVVLTFIFPILLLISAPLFGDNHKGETLYLWETSSSKKWMGFGDKETHPQYIGQVENGVPNGLGILTFPDGGKYVGEWKKGKYDGQGTSTKPNGGKYEGMFRNGIKNGQGLYTTFYGYKYEGEWKNGIFWNGTHRDKNGKIIGNYIDRKLQK